MAIRDVNNQNMIVGDPIRNTTNAQNDQQIVGDPIAQVNRTPANPLASSTRDVELNSPEAQRAIQTSMNHLGSSASIARGAVNVNPGRELSPRSVVQDELGMMHVRMDRTYNGLKVYGEQVVTHLGADGNVRSVTGDQENLFTIAGLDTRPRLSGADAITSAGREFAGPPTSTPSSELMIAKDSDGNYRLAYQVKMNNLQGDPPTKMNYMVDAKSGEIISQFNELPVLCPHCLDMAVGREAASNGVQNGIGTGSANGNTGIVPPWMSASGSASPGNRTGQTAGRGRVMPDGAMPNRPQGAGSLLGNARGAAAQSLTATGSASPNAPILDNQTTTSKITINDDLDITAVKVNVDIAHTYRGDLIVKLRSPEGKEVTLHNRWRFC
ncbi:MAG: proprotein convertase P-domain-containing protein [Blastocatellia bacterium]|nr:proprotein convertase P-domain-containing protein [Blastocatellia bacterium]